MISNPANNLGNAPTPISLFESGKPLLFQKKSSLKILRK